MHTFWFGYRKTNAKLYIETTDKDNHAPHDTKHKLCICIPG